MRGLFCYFGHFGLFLANFSWCNGQFTVTANLRLNIFCRFHFLIPYLLYESGVRMCVAYIFTKLWTGKWERPGSFSGFLPRPPILWTGRYTTSNLKKTAKNAQIVSSRQALIRLLQAALWGVLVGEVVYYIHININLSVYKIYNYLTVNGSFKTAILAPKIVKNEYRK